MRMSGAMRTAIMSLATSLAQAHADVEALGDDIGEAVVGDDLDLDVRIVRSQRSSLGQIKVSRRVLGRGDAHVPAGLPRNSPRTASSASMSSKRGPTVWYRRSPASVGATLRVVRLSSFKSSRRSKRSDGLAERGLRHPKLRGCARETASRARRRRTPARSSNRAIDKPASRCMSIQQSSHSAADCLKFLSLVNDEDIRHADTSTGQQRPQGIDARPGLHGTELRLWPGDRHGGRRSS